MTHAGDWREAYKERLRSVDEAMALIGEDDLVVMGVLTPGPLASALADRAEQLGRMHVRSLAPTEARLYSPGANGEREIELFIGEPLRATHDAKIATYLPNTFMLGMKAFDAGREEARLPDVQITSCSEPNEAGYVQFGAHMWTRKAYTKRCRATIGMIDPNITPAHGDVWVHVSEFAAFIEGVIAPVNVDGVRERVETMAPEENRAELLELLALASDDQIAIVEGLFHALPPKIVRQAFGLAEVDAEAQAIADNLAPLIRDGDTIQVGVGTPSALMFKAGAFDHAQHLGVHTELGSPGLAQLWARGNIDNSQEHPSRPLRGGGVDRLRWRRPRHHPRQSRLRGVRPELPAQPHADVTEPPDDVHQRHGRAAGHAHERGALPRWARHHRASLHCARGLALEDRGEARGGHTGHDSPLPRGHDRDRARRRAADGQESPPARG